jgi:hypothetical protein
MAVANGYGKVVTSGSVFMYDTGDTINSYIGEPTTNLALFSVISGITFNADYGGTITQTADYTVTYKGRPSLKLVSISQWNIYKYPRGGNYLGTGSPTFTFSWKMKWDNGRTPVLNNGYIYTDAQYFYPSVTVTPIDDGWFLCQCSVSGTASPIWLSGFDCSQIGTCWVTDWQVETASHATQFTAPGTTRSETDSLLPLVGNSTIDLADVSFDSNAQMTFDGTNDSFAINTNFGILSEYTIEYVAYKGAESRMPIAGRISTAFYKFGDNSWAYTHGGVFGEFYHSTSPSISGYIHCVITYDGTSVKVWRNGYYAGAQSSTGTANFSNGFMVGYWSAGGGYAWLGAIPIVKIYNRALSAAEVQQNYSKYKSRFNLS